MAYYDALITKWGTLSGTTQQKLDAVNAMTVAGPTPPMVIPTYQIYNAIVPAEFAALTAAKQQLIRDILTMGTVDASVGTQVRAVLLSTFANGTATFTAFAALAATFATTVQWWKAGVAAGGGGLSSMVSQGDLDAAGLS